MKLITATVLNFLLHLKVKWFLLLFITGTIHLPGMAGVLLRGADYLGSGNKASKQPHLAAQIVSFTLINADTEQPILTLTNNTVLNLVALPTKNFNVWANTSDGKIKSVRFSLRGKQSHNQIESRLPYTLFGDKKSNHLVWCPEVGNYTLKAIPYSATNATGEAGTEFTVSFSVIVNQRPLAQAGEDKNLALPLDSTNLNGSGTDVDGNITRYVWSQISGPNQAIFNNKTLANLRVKGLIEGKYVFSLQVKDNQNFWSRAVQVTLTIRNNSVNLPPVIVRKPANQILNLKEQFIFSAGGYADPDSGDSLTYTAKLANGKPLPAWLQFNAKNLVFKGTAPTKKTNIALLITATDKAKAFVTTNFNILVEETGLAVITGELKKWHPVTFTFTGPVTSETDSINPFLNYRLNVIFSKGTRQIIVPGYYAADGNAAETGATMGNKWRTHFSPDEPGEWTYTVSFRTGPEVAVSSRANAGTSIGFDGISGKFNIAPTNKSGVDLRAQGRLQYTGQQYLQFAETKKYFLKGGAGSPENFLAYKDFDDTYSHHPTADYTKTYAAHQGDWKKGDPIWHGNKGKGLIGALNYLAGKGMNSVYFLTMNVNGDGRDVWPWTAHTERVRYDVSKLGQWEIVFSHMDELGMMLHVITQEQENDQLLDSGELATQRKLYYRELIARFGHHLAITWNLGEENTNTSNQRKAFAAYFRQLDPYNSPVEVHTYPTHKTAIYTPLLGNSNFEGASLQVTNIANVHQETIHWLAQSAANGRKWVINLDEIGPSNRGVVPDAVDFQHGQIRRQALWGNLMAGGGGVEWYFGYQFAHSDLTAQDWRSRDHMWDLTQNALLFFNQYLPYWEMTSADTFTNANDDYCLASFGKVYAIYLPKGGSTTLNLDSSAATYQVSWYNPRTCGPLQTGSIRQLTGPGVKSIGQPPQNDGQDWVCLVTNSDTIHLNKGQIPLADNNSELSTQSGISLSVYPNPVQDQIIVNANLSEPLPLEITLQDLNGNQTASAFGEMAHEHSIQLATYHLKSGIYLLRVKYGPKYFSQRIIKY